MGKELDILKQDQLIKSDPVDNKRRRTVVINQQSDQTYGFTVQVCFATMLYTVQEYFIGYLFRLPFILTILHDAEILYDRYLVKKNIVILAII